MRAGFAARARTAQVVANPSSTTRAPLGARCPQSRLIGHRTDMETKIDVPSQVRELAAICLDNAEKALVLLQRLPSHFRQTISTPFRWDHSAHGKRMNRTVGHCVFQATAAVM